MKRFEKRTNSHFGITIQKLNLSHTQIAERLKDSRLEHEISVTYVTKELLDSLMTPLYLLQKSFNYIKLFNDVVSTAEGTMIMNFR